MRLHPGPLALVAAVFVAAPAAAAPPPASSCHSFSEGTRSWVSFRLVDVTCHDAHALARLWAGSCGRSTAPHRVFHCDVTGFSCANTKGHETPTHYVVECGQGHRRVYFTFWAHGF
jgi:hypothetical protein